MGWGSAQTPALSDALEAERARTTRLEDSVDDLTRQITAARSLLEDAHVRVGGWVDDGSITDHHAHHDLHHDLLAVDAVLHRAELIGRQA